MGDGKITGDVDDTESKDSVIDNFKKPKKSGRVKHKRKKSPEQTKYKKPKRYRQIKHKRKRKCWWKVPLNVIMIMVLISVGVGCGFSFSRYLGGKQLETEELHTLYNGKEYRLRKGIVNILFLGIDKPLAMDEIVEGRDNIGMSDAILLVSIDTKRDSIKVIAIPRDTMADVQIMTENGVPVQKKRMQICYQYAYGRTSEESNDLTVDAVSRLLYNTPIQRCCAINDTAFPILNDAVGGVDVVVQEDLEKLVPEFKYGQEIHLEGELAYRYINIRDKSRVDGSTLRTQRQKQYAMAFAKKAKEVVAGSPSVVMTIFQELQKEENMTTDITIGDIVYLFPEFLHLSFSDDIFEVLPGKSELGETGYIEYYLDTDTVKELVIDTFYEEM